MNYIRHHTPHTEIIIFGNFDLWEIRICHLPNNCFGCAPTNPIGLQLDFWEDGEDIITDFITIHITLLNSRNEVCDEAEAIYFAFSPEKAKEMGFSGCYTEEEK